MRLFLTCYMIGLLWSAVCLGASAAQVPGYVSNVQSEKSQRFYEIYLLAPQKETGPTLRDRIFNPLSKEFREKYREKFGDVDTASISYRSSGLGGTTLNPKTLAEENEKRRSYAEFVSKRLIEYHVDSYMKTQPQMKPVMQAKEKLQNVRVEVSQGVRMNIQYNLSGNTADILFENPWCESKLSLEMNPGSLGPSAPQETRFWLKKDLTQVLYVNSNFATTDGIAYADLTRIFPKQKMATKLGISTAFHNSGKSPRESSLLLGFSHLF